MFVLSNKFGIVSNGRDRVFDATRLRRLTELQRSRDVLYSLMPVIGWPTWPLMDGWLEDYHLPYGIIYLGPSSETVT